MAATGDGDRLPDIGLLKEKREQMIVRAFEEGHPIGEIARADGSSEARVRNVLRAYRVEVE